MVKVLQYSRAIEGVDLGSYYLIYIPIKYSIDFFPHHLLLDFLFFQYYISLCDQHTTWL
jgi:hypothetical protein